MRGGPGGFEVSTRPLMVGAVLMGVGGALGLAGFAVGGIALMSAARRWIQDMEQPPTEVVKHHWERTKAATAAGASAWHDGAGTPAHR
jgi:hypothetical protein